MSLTQEEMGDLVGPLSISIATRDAELKPHLHVHLGFGSVKIKNL